MSTEESTESELAALVQAAANARLLAAEREHELLAVRRKLEESLGELERLRQTPTEEDSEDVVRCFQFSTLCAFRYDGEEVAMVGLSL